jgi:hypothetical protein
VVIGKKRRKKEKKKNVMHVGFLTTCYRQEKGQKKRKGKVINQNRRVTSVIEKEHEKNNM